MPTNKALSKDEMRTYRAGLKYKKVEGDKWIIDTGKDRGSVRPIDLASRNPDELREFDSKEAAVVFEEECYQEAAKLKAAGEDWSQYRYIPRKKLTIQAKPDAAMPELINDWNDTEVGEEPEMEPVKQTAWFDEQTEFPIQEYVFLIYRNHPELQDEFNSGSDAYSTGMCTLACMACAHLYEGKEKV